MDQQPEDAVRVCPGWTWALGAGLEPELQPVLKSLEGVGWGFASP